MNSTHATDDVVISSSTTTKQTVKAKPQQILVNAKNIERLRLYHDLCGAQMTFIVNRAIEEWFETVGDTRIEVMSNHSQVAAQN